LGTLLKQNPETLDLQALYAQFDKSLERHGVNGVHVQITSEQELIIDQKVNDGIRGLGYDSSDQSLWLCIDQGNYAVSNQLWNENSVFELDDRLKDVTILRAENKLIVTLGNMHPVTCLARLIQRVNEVYMPGEYNRWKKEDAFMAKWERDTLQLELDMDIVKKLGECKIAILPVACNWQDAQWRPGADQRMIVSLK